MNREQELELIQQCVALANRKSTSLVGNEARLDTDRYVNNQRFKQELDALHKTLPHPLVHSSEIANPDSFVRVKSVMGELLVSRDGNGRVHVFHNSCRHRGAQLISTDEQHCKKRITCPYHAWSYSTDGQLASVPGKEHCFPDLDVQSHRLLEIPCAESQGFVWALPGKTVEAQTRLDNWIKDIKPSLDWAGLEHLSLFKRHQQIWNGNWKLFAEGGIETYHFAFAHKNTIGPSFMNNTAVIDAKGHHLQLVMPTKNLTEVANKAEDERQLRTCSHVLLLLFPTNALLVQHEHVDWIHFRPISPTQTEISITTLVPKHQQTDRQHHWQRNHDITVAVLNEDFTLGEGIQASINTGALSHLNFGRNEWALAWLNAQIDRKLGLQPIIQC